MIMTINNDLSHPKTVPARLHMRAFDISAQEYKTTRNREREEEKRQLSRPDEKSFGR
jgi:hypothetical protein